MHNRGAAKISKTAQRAVETSAMQRGGAAKISDVAQRAAKEWQRKAGRLQKLATISEVVASLQRDVFGSSGRKTANAKKRSCFPEERRSVRASKRFVPLFFLKRVLFFYVTLIEFNR